jgi:hypothetical protein
MISKVENGENSMDLGTFYRLIRYTGIDPMAALEDLFETPRRNRADGVGLHVARRKRARVRRIGA